MESSKIFEKIKEISKLQKCAELFPKLSKLVLNMFCGIFFGKKVFSHCSMEGGVFEKFQKKSKKNSKFHKCPKSFPTVCKRVLNMFWGNFFRKKSFCTVFHGVSSLLKFSQKSKKFQNSKNAFNRFQKCPNVFWTSFGAMFLIFFCPVFHAVHFRFSGLKIKSSESRN